MTEWLSGALVTACTQSCTLGLTVLVVMLGFRIYVRRIKRG